MQENILIFGANGFLAKAFIKKYSKVYNILPVYKSATDKSDLSFDFLSSDHDSFCRKVDCKIDGILFLQGLNPSKGIDDITPEDFKKMIDINLSTPLFLIKSLKNKLNINSSIIFISSVAKKKGSYDPSYAAAKSGISGLILSLANALQEYRFNSLSLGLVEKSPVFNSMTMDFKKKHADRMQGNQFIKSKNVIDGLHFLLQNKNINKEDIAIDGGYT